MAEGDRVRLEGVEDARADPEAAVGAVDAHPHALAQAGLERLERPAAPVQRASRNTPEGAARSARSAGSVRRGSKRSSKRSPSSAK
jgi:hypothetical protein